MSDTTASVAELLHAAYSFVRGVEMNRAISAMTLDHLLQEHIERIKGGDSRFLLGEDQQTLGERTSKLDYLTEVETGIDQLVTAVEEAGDDPLKLAQLGLDVPDQGTAT